MEYVAYMIHDPVGNCEGVLTEFDTEILARAAADGMVFIGITEDGERHVVQHDDVVSPASRTHEVVIAKQSYVDDRTAATVAVFDAVSQILNPEPTGAAEDGTGSRHIDPIEAFEAALEKLRELA